MNNILTELQTPADYAVFLVIGTIFIVAIALVTYLGIMRLVWRWRLKGNYEFRDILIPDGIQIGFKLTQVFLGVLATGLVAIAMIEKQDIVDEILNAKELVVESKIIEETLKIDVSESDVGSNLTTDLISELSSKSTMQIVNGLLEANMPQTAQEFLEKSVERWKNKEEVNYQLYFIIASSILLIFYIVWYVVKRWSETRDKPKPPQYIEMLKQFAYPAICIPLTMLSVAEIENTKKLSERAFAIIQTKAVDNRLSQNLAQKITETVQHAKNLRNSQVDGNLSSINSKLQTLLNHTHQKYAQIDDLNKLSQTVNSLEQSLDELQTQTKREGARLHQSIGLLDNKIVNNANEISRINNTLKFIQSNRQNIANNKNKILKLENDLQGFIKKSGKSFLYVETNRSFQIRKGLSRNGTLLTQKNTPILTIKPVKNGAPFNKGTRLLYVLDQGRYSIWRNNSSLSQLFIQKGQIQMFSQFVFID